MSFSYHPAAQAEFQLILTQGSPALRRCLGQAIMRNNRIAAGVEPLRRPQEFIGPGAAHSALFAVEFADSLVEWVEYVYDELGADVVVAAIDASRFGAAVGSRVGGDARQRARGRSR